MKQELVLKDSFIHGTPQIPLRIYNQYYENGGLAVPYHWHREIELIYVEQGCMELTINAITERVYENQFICVNSEQLHHICSIGNLSSIHHALVFSPDILSFSYWDEIQSEYIQPLLGNKLLLPQNVDTDKTYGKNIVRLFCEILEQYRKKEEGWYLDVKGCLYKILAIMAKEKLFIFDTDVKGKNYNYKLEQAKQVLSYIHTHYTERIYLDELAKVMGMNSQYFCRFFKSIFQKTPIEYINYYRIIQAMKLLKNCDMSILEVGLCCGFENPSYFIKIFKNQNHMTPSEYKQTLQKTASSIHRDKNMFMSN